MELDWFVLKITEAITLGIHLLVVDIQPPTTRAPHGIHGAVCAELDDYSYVGPPNKPLTVVPYIAMPFGIAYVGPLAVGDNLPDTPLFLDVEAYVNVPLEATYESAFKNIPGR